MVTKFQKFLEKNDLSASTIRSYVWTVNHFIAQYEKIDKENLLAYKGFLIEHFKPQTVNLRLQALNKFLEFTNRKSRAFVTIFTALFPMFFPYP